MRASGRSWAGLATAFVVATAPLGDGGQQPDLLMLHHTVLAAALAFLALGPDTFRVHLWERRRLALLLAAFVAQAYLLSPYRYASLLVLAQIAAGFAVFTLAAAAAGAAGGRALVLAAVTAAGLFTAIWSLAEGVTTGRPWGPFANPHHGATAAAVAAAVLAAAAAAPLASRRDRLLAAAGLAVLAAHVAAVASKGGALAFAAAVVAALLLHRRRRLVLAAVATVLLLAVLPTPLGRRLQAGVGGDPLVFERLRIWRAAAAMARDHALAGGVGLGAFASVAPRYNFPVAGTVARFGKYPNVAHNEYLELAAEMSLPGLLLLGWPLAWAARRWRSAGAPLAIAPLAGLTAIALHALLDAVLHNPALVYDLAALIGLLAATPVSPSEPSAPSPSPAGARPPPPYGRSLCLLAIAALWAGQALVPWLGDRAFRAHRQGQPGQLDRALRLVPGHAGYRAARGGDLALRFEGDEALATLDAARHAFTAAVRLDPLPARHRGGLARLEHRAFLGPFPAPELAAIAAGHYREAIDRDPFNPFLRIDLASLLAAAGRIDEALAAARAAVALEPNFRQGQALLESVALAAGDRALARQAGQEVGRIDALRRAHPGPNRYETMLLAPVPRAPAPGAER